MKKVILILAFLFCLGFSCGLLTDVCETIGVNFTSVVYDTKFPDYYEDSYLETDTFNYKILFKIKVEYDCEAWAERTFSSLNYNYGSCYATSKATEFKNYIDTSSFEIYINKQILYSNTLIPSNTDLFSTDISKDIIIKDLNTRDYPVQIIMLSDEFYQNLNIMEGNSTFYLSCSTNDNRYFIDSTTVYINIK